MKKAEIFLLSLAAILFVSLAFFVFFYSSLAIYPKNTIVTNQPKPNIVADWSYAFGARLKAAKVKLDGIDITGKVKRTARGFNFRPLKGLKDGNHTIEAELEYKFLYDKKVRTRWSFKTDTVPPAINLSQGNVSVLASRNKNIDISGKTEPLSSLLVRLNKKRSFTVFAEKNGQFNVKLGDLKKKNKLAVVAKDLAGNKTRLKLPVLIDKLPPHVESISPAPKSKVFGQTITFSFKLKDESQVYKLRLFVDGQELPHQYNPSQKIISYNHQILADGKHEAEVQITDVANNQARKKWWFLVDTTRLLLKQSQFTLFIFKRGQLVRSVKVAVGMPAWPTPMGHWKVVRKENMPWWHNPHKSWSAGMPEHIPPGPSNPLGLRALHLSAEAVAIHGTEATWSIGQAASHGCIRVANSEIVQIFPLIPEGTPIDIVP